MTKFEHCKALLGLLNEIIELEDKWYHGMDSPLASDAEHDSYVKQRREIWKEFLVLYTGPIEDMEWIV